MPGDRCSAHFTQATRILPLFSLQTAAAISSLGFTKAQLYSKNLGQQGPIHRDQPSQLLSVRSQECENVNGCRAACPSAPPTLQCSPVALSLPLNWVFCTRADQESRPPRLGDRREGGSREIRTTQRALCLCRSFCQVSIPSHTQPPQHPRGVHFTLLL